MFERYTERARRVIFFARYEASAYGSPTIETEHFLLGLVREDKNLIDRFLKSPAEAIRERVEKHITIQPKISTSENLPLTDECKRILAHANEEAERLAHGHIGTEHLLLGILRETHCLAARLLVEAGIQLEPTRAELSGSLAARGTPSDTDLRAADRASLHALVDRLPESALGRALWMLDQLL